VPIVRVIDEHGQQLGVFQVKDALRIAGERNRDLIEIVPNANPPVCKIVEFGKFKYEHQKKEKAVRKTQHSKALKEVQLHPNIDTHDLEFKARHAREFLLAGNKVKVNLIFKGREMAYIENGERVLKEFVEKVSEVGKLEVFPKMEGRQMHAIIAPQPAAVAKAAKKSGGSGSAHPKKDGVSKEGKSVAKNTDNKIVQENMPASPAEAPNPAVVDAAENIS